MDDQIVASDLERTPSLLDGLESGWYVEGGVAARYQFAADLESFLATPGVAGSPMADEMRAAGRGLARRPRRREPGAACAGFPAAAA